MGVSVHRQLVQKGIFEIKMLIKFSLAYQDLPASSIFRLVIHLFCVEWPSVMLLVEAEDLPASSIFRHVIHLFVLNGPQ